MKKHGGWIEDELDEFLVESSDHKMRKPSDRKKNVMINGVLHRRCHECQTYKTKDCFHNRRTISPVTAKVKNTLQYACKECCKK